MKPFCISFLLILISSCLFAQQFDWVRTYGVPGGNRFDVTALTMATDKHGNVYTAGNYFDSLKFDSTSFLKSPVGSSGFYINKYDSSGNLLWIKSIQSTSYCIPRAMALDSSGNIYFTGDFGGKVDFDPDSISDFFLGDTTNTTGKLEAFVCKLSSSGGFIWAKAFLLKSEPIIGTLKSIHGLSIAIDKNEDVIIAGAFQDTVDFDPGAGTFYLSDTNLAFAHDTYFVKLRSDGSFKWAKKYSFRFGNYNHQIEIDQLGNIYTAGVFSDTLYFDVDTGTIQLNNIGSGQSIFITKLDSNGKILWANSMGSIGYNHYIGIELDTVGDLYLLSKIGSQPFYNSKKIDIDISKSPGTLMCKINSNGSLENARFINKYNASTVSFSLHENKLYVFGQFFEKPEFYFDSLTTFSLPRSNTDKVFVYCLDLIGDGSWVKGFGGIANESNGAISIDSFGNIYSMSAFKDTVDFNPGLEIEIRTPIGEKDIFLHKLTPCNISKSIQTDTICGGDSLVIGQNAYKKTGNYIDAYESSTGCDSLVTIALYVQTLKTDTVNYRICQGDSLLVDRVFYKTSGTYQIVYSFPNSCDSTFVVVLEVDSIATTSNSFAICEGDDISVGNNVYSVSGNYIDTLQAANGCDSIISTQLTVNPVKRANQNIEICEGDSILVGAMVYKNSGNYTDTLASISGCDSVVSTALNVKQNKRSNQTVRLCFGESLTVGSTTYSKNGNYIDTLTTQNGCDSIVRTNLIVDELLESSQSFSLCEVDSAIVGKNIYKNSGTFLDTLSSSLGCDSLVSTTIEKIDLTFDSTGINLLFINQKLANYQWLDCQNQLMSIIGETNQTISIVNKGIFAVEVSYKNCIDTSKCVFVSFEEIKAESFLLYPNPTKQFVTVILPSSGKLKIYDPLGRLVLAQNLNAGKNQLDVSFLSSGFYTLKYDSQFGVILEKLVISR